MSINRLVIVFIMWNLTLCFQHVLGQDLFSPRDLMSHQREALEKKDPYIYRWWSRSRFRSLEKTAQTASEEFRKFSTQETNNVLFTMVIEPDIMFGALRIAVSNDRIYVFEKDRYDDAFHKYVLANTNDMTRICKDIQSGPPNDPGGRGMMIAEDAAIAFLSFTNTLGQTTGAFFMPVKDCDGRYVSITELVDSIRTRLYKINENKENPEDNCSHKNK